MRVLLGPKGHLLHKATLTCLRHSRSTKYTETKAKKQPYWETKHAPKERTRTIFPLKKKELNEMEFKVMVMRMLNNLVGIQQHEKGH